MRADVGSSVGARRSAPAARLLVLALACAGALGLAGCAASALLESALPTDPAELDCAPRLAFLADPGTTRDEVLLRLGPPSSAYEQQRIVVYPLLRDLEGRFHVSTSDVAIALSAQPQETLQQRIDLVLVFGADGVLQRRALVDREKR